MPSERLKSRDHGVKSQSRVSSEQVPAHGFKSQSEEHDLNSNWLPSLPGDCVGQKEWGWTGVRDQNDGCVTCWSSTCGSHLTSCISFSSFAKYAFLAQGLQKRNWNPHTQSTQHAAGLSVWASRSRVRSGLQYRRAEVRKVARK